MQRMYIHRGVLLRCLAYAGMCCRRVAAATRSVGLTRDARC